MACWGIFLPQTILENSKSRHQKKKDHRTHTKIHGVALITYHSKNKKAQCYRQSIEQSGLKYFPSSFPKIQEEAISKYCFKLEHCLLMTTWLSSKWDKHGDQAIVHTLMGPVSEKSVSQKDLNHKEKTNRVTLLE